MASPSRETVLPNDPTPIMDREPMPKTTAINDVENPGFEVVPEDEIFDERSLGAPWWVRLTLLGVAAGMISLFAVGAMLHPYEADGTPKTHGTHRQLGLPPCSFYALTGMPCPSCGFTTAFSLVAHGDLTGAMRVNSVGTLLALYCLAVIPWALFSVWRRRLWLVRSLEHWALVSLSVFVPLMLVRWIVLIVGNRWSGQS